MVGQALWDVQLENHSNLILFRTRGEAVRDWFADYTDATSWGTSAYVVEQQYVPGIVRALQEAGFIVK